VRKLPPKLIKPVVAGILIDPSTIAVPDTDAPGVVRLLTVEPTEEQRYSHALRLLQAARAERK